MLIIEGLVIFFSSILNLMFILVLIILQRKTGSGGGHQRRLSAVSQRIQLTDHYLGAFETHSSRSVIEVNQLLHHILIRIGVICKKT